MGFSFWGKASTNRGLLLVCACSRSGVVVVEIVHRDGMDRDSTLFPLHSNTDAQLNQKLLIIVVVVVVVVCQGQTQGPSFISTMSWQRG